MKERVEWRENKIGNNRERYVIKEISTELEKLKERRMEKE